MASVRRSTFREAFERLGDHERPADAGFRALWLNVRRRLLAPLRTTVTPSLRTCA